MRLTTLAKVGVGITAVALLACTATIPAVADPASPSAFGKLVGVGSDTTQDVMDGIAAAAGGPSSNPLIASYDATIASTITPRKGGVAIDRPNGSGDGLAALEVSIGQSATAVWKTYQGTAAPTQLAAATDATTGQVDFARSSSGPAAPLPGGVVTYVPFATDALDFATSSNSKFNAFPNGLTPAQIKSIYSGAVNEIITGSAADDPKLVDDTTADAYALVGDEVATPIHAYVPQAGSGTRKFWLASFLSIADSASTIDNSQSPIYDQKVTGTFGKDGLTPVSPTFSVQEHDGSVLSGDAGAIMPFSIGKYVADQNGLATPDNTNGAKLGTVLFADQTTGTAPTTGAAGTLKLSDNFVTEAKVSANNATLTRLVYNIIPTREIVKNSVTNWTFVGTSSVVCQESAVIANYGFQPLSATTGPNACGDTSRQAVAASTATVILTPSATKAAIGTTFTASANVQSVGNGGGTVVFKSGDKVIDTETLAAGSTTVASDDIAAASLPVGTASLTATFTPNFEGVQSGSVSPAVAVTIAKATTTVTASAPSVKHTSSPYVTVHVTAANGVATTGHITVKLGSKTLKSGSVLVNGVVKIKLPKIAKGSHTLTVEYLGDANTLAKTITTKFTSK